MFTKITVTGAGGYIGSRLISKLAPQAEKIYAFDNLMYNQGPYIYRALDRPNIDFYNEDIRLWSNNLKYAIQDSEIIIPLAAIVGAPICDKMWRDSEEINYSWFEDLLNIVDNQLIFYPNTNSGYGTTGEEICTEETPLRPISHYAITKQETEELLLKSYNKATCFRLATVFGTSYRNRLDLLVNNLTYRAIMEGKLTVFDGHFRRNYIHIDDIVRAFIMGMERCFEFGQVYNLGNDSINTTKQQLVETICRITNATWTEDSEKTDTDKRDYVVSSEKIGLRGFEPTRNLEYGINEIKQFCKFLCSDEKMRKEQTLSMFNYDN